MAPASLALWVSGLVLIVVGVLRVRGPLRRRRDLDATAANLQRYDEWRGSRLRPEPGDRTGADEMRILLDRQVRAWSAAVAAGVGLTLAGFLVR